jgi:predicted transcriptional regulator
MNDIFDLSNIEDLPSNLVGQLKLASEIDDKVLNLFSMAKSPLNLTQLLVGFYRQYNEEKTRNYMMTLCYRLVKKGFLEKTGKKGEYIITEKGLSVINEDKEEEELA